MADIIFPGATPIDSIGASKLPNNVDLAIWRGDYREFIVTFKKEDGTASDLTGHTAQAVIRADTNTGTTSYNFTCTITGNNVRLYLPSSVSKTMAPGDYVWNFQLTKANGDVTTYLAGDVKVYAEVDA